MKTLSTLLLAATLSTGMAAAQQVQNFTVAGKGHDGSTYSGTVTLTEIKPSGAGKMDAPALKVVWTIGTETTEGIAIVNQTDNDVLSVAYSYGGVPGVAIMRGDDTKGTASGIWWIKGMNGVGEEVWTPKQ